MLEANRQKWNLAKSQLGTPHIFTQLSSPSAHFPLSYISFLGYVFFLSSSFMCFKHCSYCHCWHHHFPLHLDPCCCTQWAFSSPWLLFTDVSLSFYAPQNHRTSFFLCSTQVHHGGPIPLLPSLHWIVSLSIHLMVHFLTFLNFPRLPPSTKMWPPTLWWVFSH